MSNNETVFDTISSLTKSSKVARQATSVEKGGAEGKEPGSVKKELKTILKRVQQVISGMDLPPYDVVYLEKYLAVVVTEYRRRKKVVLPALTSILKDNSSYAAKATRPSDPRRTSEEDGGDTAQPLHMTALHASRHAAYYGYSSSVKGSEDSGPPSSFGSTQKPNPKPVVEEKAAPDSPQTSREADQESRREAYLRELVDEVKPLLDTLLAYESAVQRVQTCVERRDSVWSALCGFVKFITAEMGGAEVLAAPSPTKAIRRASAPVRPLPADRINDRENIYKLEKGLNGGRSVPLSLKPMDMKLVREKMEARDGDDTRAYTARPFREEEGEPRRSSSRPHSSSPDGIMAVGGLSFHLHPVPKSAYTPCLYYYLHHLQVHTLLLTEAVVHWRSFLGAAVPFPVKGKNCLLEVLLQQSELALAPVVWRVLGERPPPVQSGKVRRSRSTPSKGSVEPTELGASSLTAGDWVEFPLLSPFRNVLAPYAAVPPFLSNLLSTKDKKGGEVALKDAVLPPSVTNTDVGGKKMTIKRLKLAEEYLKKEVQFQLIRLKESYEVALRGEYHLQLLNLPYMEGEAERRTFSGSGASWQRLQGSSEEKTKKKKKTAVSDGTLLSVNMSDYTLSLKWLSGLEHQLRLLKERKSDIA